ncbi:MAG: SusD/RagB family nutrient-binding outer membrane lipoprotein [Bacteroidetes bacterium]|nr:SusD/RagB family nutrient-binding outer membrane lipoprotein [Bacteroidota bacterium]MBU1372768.1 SusD/RagB family nutrient-binding outer membrane lipoprotein [Bacteroidota bacterium]MBU1484964.1 SusD/RagB family nutrient-binding outer membrane lipoprotein [Bacteroidota bacterium]MBU1759283.1 SusD/RagB family nutrient-binding outer membrane lipoprotein [Bacteroidota bacterium]MBU2266683.1 SusD/RagB family nutrient-binding outer membrane lipoprotein [Bacteroidota bacterium]
MKFRNKIIYSLALTLAIGVSSCKKTLDINTNPYTATKVEPKLLFGYALTAWDAAKNGGDVQIPVMLMDQSVASGGNYGWGAGNVYDISPYSTGNTWNTYYTNGGNNLKLAIKAAESATTPNKNAAAQCKIVLAQLLYETTTLFGDIPFSEAYQPDKFPSPHYDNQKDVLEGVISLCNEAISQIDVTSPLKITDYDVFYKGDMSKWTKLANSIKFKTLMVMVDKDPTKAAAIGTLLANPSSMISSAADNELFPYYTATNQENPKYRLFKQYTNGENQWFFANKNVFDFMQPKNDPRIPKFFDKGPKATTYKAVDTEEEADGTASLISAYLNRKNAPSVIFSYQEISLLEAEAYARGLGVPKNLVTAQQYFAQGVKASMDFYESDATAVQAYMSTQLTNLSTATDPVKEIHIQQWVDLMDRPLESFVQWRRSGPSGNEVPALTLPVGAPAGPLIRRYPLPNSEITANPNIPNPQPVFTDKMWFDL